MALRRRPALPASAAALLPSGDRRLAAGALADGAWAVATASALMVVDATHVRWRRPWHEVDHAGWEAEPPRATVTWVDGSPDTVMDLADPFPSQFPAVLRERVQASVVHTERLDLRGGGVARAVIRRAHDGSLHSQVILDASVEPTAAERTAIEALEARARETVGLGP